MSHQNLIGLFSVVCAVLGYGTYIVTILKGKTKPHIFSWVVWGILMGIVTFAQWTKGGEAGTWSTGFSVLVCVVVVILSFRRGEKHITATDWIAFIGALTTIPVWYLTSDPFWAVILATVIETMAFYPTFRKSFFKPYGENCFMYLVDDVKFIMSVAALGSITVTTALYPLFCVVMNTSLVVMILWRRSKQKN